MSSSVILKTCAAVNIPALRNVNVIGKHAGPYSFDPTIQVWNESCNSITTELIAPSNETKIIIDLDMDTRPWSDIPTREK